MRVVTRVLVCVLCAVVNVSGAPNPHLTTADGPRCLSFDRSEELGLDVSALRDEYRSAVTAFPERRPELAEAWKELQYALRDCLREAGMADLGGRSMFTVFFFEPDGRIARVLYRGLDADEETVFCEVVDRLAKNFRFPLQSEAPFSQCGTTHFEAN